MERGYNYDARQWDAREDCEVRQILDRIADKWSLLAIALLDGRTLRFTELQRTEEHQNEVAAARADYDARAA